MVPGISFSPDKMLQSRLFSYGDAARYRLGVNHHQIPVNAPKCPFHSNHRDGAMRVDSNNGAEICYEPNSKGALQEQPDFAEPPAQQQVLFENTARSVGGASKAIQERHIANCTKADPAYGAGVAAALVKGASSPSPNPVV